MRRSDADLRALRVAEPEAPERQRGRGGTMPHLTSAMPERCTASPSLARRARRPDWHSRTAALLIFAFVGNARAWGPHSEITAAALNTLPEVKRLRAYLGADFERLARDYCWMGDWQEAVRPDHYADDYLLFPSSPRHISHMHPHVRATYAPFIRRALQAIRTESPREAARWVGSLLHFLQDAGAPPHTTGIGGALHGKMERWVDESRISIAGYQPRLLGTDDDSALRGFEERMAGLHDFAK